MLFNRSAPHARVTPVLTVSDVRAAVAFYEAAFAFVERVRIGDAHRAQLGLPGPGAHAELIVAEVRPGRRTPTADSRSHQLMLKVDDVAATAARAQQLGATVASPLRDYEYGERQITVDDPFGHQWTLTQTVTDTAPEDWGGTSVAPREQTLRSTVMVHVKLHRAAVVAAVLAVPLGAATAAPAKPAKTKARATASCGLSTGGTPLGKKTVTAKIRTDIACSIQIKDFDEDLDTSNVKLTRWTTWHDKSGDHTSDLKEQDPDSSTTFGNFPTIATSDIPACADFSIHMQIHVQDVPIWQQDVAVHVACAAPKAVTGKLSCMYTAQDGTMIRWPGNGTKLKPRLSADGPIDCDVELGDPPKDGTTIKGQMQINTKPWSELLPPDSLPPDGKGHIQAEFSKDTFDECADVTIKARAVDDDGNTRYSGSLKITQFCPD